jgi:hypothetical protein
MDRKMLDYLPEIMKEYSEFIQLANAEQKTKEQLWEDIYKMFAEGFVSTETVIGAKRWEKTLGLTPKDTDSIEIRNFRIRARLLRDLPYTYRTLKKMLAAICGENGYTIDMDVDNYSIVVRVALGSKQFKDEVDVLLDAVVPAHIILDIDLRYNTHRMVHDTGLSNRQLQQYTNAQIKVEPFGSDALFI